MDGGTVWSCHDHYPYEPTVLGWPDQPTGPDIAFGLERLAEADVIVGHNVINFDVPAIQKLFPDWKPRGIVRDTIVLTRLLWPKEAVTEIDFARAAKGLHPNKLIGSYSLEAWGFRLGNYKGDFRGPWETWTPEMQSYCEQDVEVTALLWQKCQEKLSGKEDGQPWGPECVDLEHEVAWIIARQERYGFAFDVDKATKLYATLAARRTELEHQLQLSFPPKTITTAFTPKANNKTRGYVKGVPTTKSKIVAFNPSSRKQVAARLMELGWKPEEFTADGTPKLDDDILSSLPYERAKPLAEYYLIEKRLGALAEGKEAWLKLERNGRIHGRVTPNGAVTGRMTHSRPNTANVPGILDKKTGKPQPYGRECRELFAASPGKKLVGCDADGLEGRCLGHFMAKYDGGAFIQTLLEGKKEDGTDLHSANAKALGCARETAKTWFYAFIYGAGNWKLGYTLTGKKGPKQRVTRAGGTARSRFLQNLPALKTLVDGVASVLTKRRWLRGLDGRKVYVRAEHAALNTLLQSAGALIMKRALVILDNNLQAAGLVPGKDYEFVANVHDEFQIDVAPQFAELVGETASDAIRLAGEHFKFLCPTKGNYVIGDNWADTH